MHKIVKYLFHLFLAVPCYSNILASCHSQPLGLIAQYSNAVLPSGLMQSTAIFDGEDSIYLFGSSGIRYGSTRHDRILKYNTSADTIVEVASSFGFNSCCGTVAKKDELFIYFGGWTLPHAFKYDPKLNKVTNVVTDTIPDFMYSGSVQYPPDSNKLIIFGPSQTAVIGEIDLETFEYKVIGTLPYIFLRISAVLVVGDCAMLFGHQRDSTSHSRFVKVNLTTMESTFAPVDFDFIGKDSYAVYDARGKAIYLVVGYAWDTNTTITRTEGIYKIDPDTMAWEFIFVENWPCKGDTYFRYAPEQVHVEKLNRIYFFGGSKNYNVINPTQDSIYNFKIWYVELNSANVTTSMTTTIMAQTDATTTISSTIVTATAMEWPEMDINSFTCNERWNGSYLIPYYCSLYMICHEDGGIPEFYQCPPPFNYNAEKRTCDNSECLASCENYGSVDGKYPHPQDFSRILVCKDGRELPMESCPLPTLYHPLEKTCVPPELLPFKIHHSSPVAKPKQISDSEENNTTRWEVWIVMLLSVIVILILFQN